MILIAGASGALGGEIARRLRTRGRPVRALVRTTTDPGKVAALDGLGVEVVRGDLRDRASLDQACAACDAVISTVTMIGSGRPGDSFETVDEQGTLQLVAAAEEAGVRQFVYISFPVEQVPDNPLSRAKRAVQDALLASSMTCTILQPSLFMESWLGPHLGVDAANGRARIFGSGEAKVRYIAVADVAEFAVRALESPSARTAVVRVGGPEALTQREAIARFESALGRPLEVEQVPEPALEAQYAAATDPMQRTFAALMLSAARGDDVPTEAAGRQFPFEMTTVEQFARRTAGASG